MTAEHVQGDEPLIPMPALTLDALRQAVAAVVPSRLPEFFQEIQDAFSQAGGSPCSGLGRADAGQQGQDFADGAIPAGEFRQREMRLDVVAVAAAVLLLDYVADLDQFGDDAECAALGDIQAGRDVPEAHSGVTSHAQQNPGVVGQEGPARHPNRLPDSGKNLLVFCCERSLKSGTGRQPPATASFPGLPEELMNIGAIVLTVPAHDARNAAHRLILPGI